MKDLKIGNLTSDLKSRIKEAQDKYLVAKAQLETVELIEHENKTKILANNIFTDEEGNRILTADRDFLINEKEFNQFLELLFIENKKSGLPVTNKEEAIDWKFKKQLIDLEKGLFKLQLKTVPENYRPNIKKAQEHYKFRDKAIDLILMLDCTV